MGNQRVTLANNKEQTQEFIKHLLKDIRALGQMLDEGWFEIDKTRIGAEQELCLVDQYGKPAPVSMKVLEEANRENFTTELALFNMEINLDPIEFKADCLSQMEHAIDNQVGMARKAAHEFDSDLVMVGILPTIRKFDLELDNLTPLHRYQALCQAINKLRGEEFEMRLNGIDELLMRFNSPLLEGCNTGFQVHLQVKPDEFVQKYNIAQAITGPVLAAAVNSPMLFGKRLWQETRVALFQQSIDTRKVGDHLRESTPRVTFGNNWLKESILEIYKEDIARYRVMLSAKVNEDVASLLENGKTPQLTALQVHNSTVYRWNRPCYGISDNKAHLRIENRVLPSGPTVVDEVANASFWLGLLYGMPDVYPDISKILEFEDAKTNFISASRMGLDTQFHWVEGQKVNPEELIRKELLPIAREGLEKNNIDTGDIDKYLGIIDERVKSAQTGASWMLQSYAEMIKKGTKPQTISAITTSMQSNQKKNEPVHTWPIAQLEDMHRWHPSHLLVEEFMTTDLFTAQSDDLVEFVSELMIWRHIRYMPIENDQKQLVGLITQRMVFEAYHKIINADHEPSETVGDIMIREPIVTQPEATILEAIELMDSNKIGCLPVVKSNRLVGVITEKNYMTITARLLKALDLDERLQQQNKDAPDRT